jgi:hypothetical protein
MPQDSDILSLNMQAINCTAPNISCLQDQQGKPAGHYIHTIFGAVQTVSVLHAVKGIHQHVTSASYNLHMSGDAHVLRLLLLPDCLLMQVAAAASHQQPVQIDGSLKIIIISSSSSAHSSNGAGAPVLLHASSVLQWSAASHSSSSSSSQQHVREGSSSGSSVDSIVQPGSWDSLQHVPSYLADAHDAPASPLAEDVEPSSSNGRQQYEHTSSSSSSAGKHRLSEAGHQLMIVITQQSTCWQDLAQLVQAQSHCFSSQHCAASLHQLSNLWLQQQQEALQQQELRAELRLQRPLVLQLAAVLLRGLRQQINKARGRDVADAVCAAAKLGMQVHVSHPADTSAVTRSEPAGANASRSSNGQSVRAVAGQLSGVADALLQRSAELMRGGRLKALPLVRLLWGITQLGLQPSSDWWAAALDATAMQLQQTQLQQQQEPPQQQQLEHRYNGQSLSLVGWAVAKLQAPTPDAWWCCYADAAAALLPQMQPQELSRCIWAFATAGKAPDAGWVAAFYAASGACMHKFDPQGSAVMVWALAVLQQQQPPQQWLQQYEAASASCMYGYSMQHLSMTLWALGSISKASATTTVSSSLSSSSSSSPHHPRQQQQLSAAWLEQAFSQLTLVESQVTAQGLACVLWGLVQLRVAVPEARLQQLEMLVGPVLRDAEPQGLAIIVWALGQLR